MKCPLLVSSGLFCLGLLVPASAQDAQPKPAGQHAAPPAAVPATPVAAPAAVEPALSEPQILEMYGWLVGKELGLAELGFGKDQIDAVVKGLLSAAAGKEPLCDPDKAVPQVKDWMQKKQDVFLGKVRDQNLAEAKAFFEKLKENKNVVELPSGLRYEIVQEGKGALPALTDTLKVHYTGRLVNGTVFDSSVQRGEPVEIQLDKVIPGWTEGLQKISQGGKIRLYIPPHLAYGDRPPQGIPPGATLIFDVELLGLRATPPAPAAPEASPEPFTPVPGAPKN